MPPLVVTLFSWSRPVPSKGCDKDTKLLSFRSPVDQPAAVSIQKVFIARLDACGKRNAAEESMILLF